MKTVHHGIEFADDDIDPDEAEIEEDEFEEDEEETAIA